MKGEPVSDENLTPLFRALALLVAAAYVVPIVLVAGALTGAGVFIGWVIWG